MTSDMKLNENENVNNRFDRELYSCGHLLTKRQIGTYDESIEQNGFFFQGIEHIMHNLDDCDHIIEITLPINDPDLEMEQISKYYNTPRSNKIIAGPQHKLNKAILSSR